MGIVCCEAEPIFFDEYPGKGLVADIYVLDVTVLKEGQNILLSGKLYKIKEIINYTGLLEETMVGVWVEECGVNYELHES